MPKNSTKSKVLSKLSDNIADFVPAMVSIYDIQSGEYLYVNKAVESLLGYSPKEFLNGGLDFAVSLVHPADAPLVIEKNQGALEQANTRGKNPRHEIIAGFEYRLKHKNGSWIWLLTEGAVFKRDEKDRVSQVINISIDITSRRSSEDYLRHMTDELKSLNKTKDEFINIASHQLRTPATAIKQYLGLLLGGYSDPLTEDQKVFVERAYESNQRQLDIVEDILRTAQLDAEKLLLKFKSEDIRLIIDDVINVVSPQIYEKNQKIKWKKPAEPVFANVDRSQILMVFENLLENASHYTNEGKQISVSVEEKSGKVQIHIKDQGVGIDKKDLDKLFHKFSRIDNPLSIKAGGTGLGLYWASKITRLHDGEIKVKSKLGNGTCFSVILPAPK